MSRDLAEKVADAVLYEGFMLYPYRASAIKNRQLWTFGVLYPPGYDEVRDGTERAAMHSECVLVKTGEAVLHVQVRFLQLQSRQVMASTPQGPRPVPSLAVDGRAIESWNEGVQRSLSFRFSPDGSQQSVAFAVPGSHDIEPLLDKNGSAVGTISKTQQELRGQLLVRAEEVRDQTIKLTIDLTNGTSLPPDSTSRNAALLRSLLSAQTILTVTGGEFVSLLEPPENLREVISSCRSIGNFPVLLGEPSTRDRLFCSPILLYDYPQTAPESAGDFYDATEMDEMLTLRVLTLTDEEKAEMRSTSSNACELLQRTEETAREQLRRTHGAIRSLQPESGNHD